jgi:hypothetical protein
MEVSRVPRWIRFILVVCLPLFAFSTAHAAVLSLTLVGGAIGMDGSTVLVDPLAQESLTGTTLSQIGVPAIYDLTAPFPMDLTFRLTNISDVDLLFPDALPGVSVLTEVYGLAGYTTKQNIAAGGARGSNGAAGTDGAVSRTALDMTETLDAIMSAASGSNGGGGGAATGVANNYISITGASGAELAAYLANLTLHPGEYVDIAGFAHVLAFGRVDDAAMIGFGFDLPTFSFGGTSFTTGAWTATCGGPRPDVVDPPPVTTSTTTASAHLPGTSGLMLIGGLAGALGRRRDFGRLLNRA